LLYEVSPHDPRTLVLGCAAMLLLALAASAVPALRASRQDPALTLRAE
jgi:ABC-type lipoprotein release transport system permease subunit